VITGAAVISPIIFAAAAAAASVLFDQCMLAIGGVFVGAAIISTLALASWPPAV
jgi:hypothetical protein